MFVSCIVLLLVIEETSKNDILLKLFLIYVFIFFFLFSELKQPETRINLALLDYIKILCDYFQLFFDDFFLCVSTNA